jgi:hydrogenase maturation protein HypF
LVCTSGNVSDEPICIDTDDARERLAHIADVFLNHDRQIARPLDDSVVRTAEGRLEIIRRARGFTPKAIDISIDGPVTLAFGGHQKNVIALAIGHEAILSQHLGDIGDHRTRDVFLHTIDDLTRLFDVAPELLACDLHPDYFSTQVARRMAESRKIPLVHVQHHHAHIAACMAECHVDGAVLGFAWDGTGYGADGTVWGGETLLCDGASVIRWGHLLPFPLVGGTAAVKDPRRAAFGLLLQAGVEKEQILGRWFDHAALRTLETMAARKINSPTTSSVGRLFDAIAALTRVCERPTYDGQAAMELEWELDANADRAGAYPVEIGQGSPVIIDWRPTLGALLCDVRDGQNVATISARFHNGLVCAALAMAERAGIERIVLSGGCFQNAYLSTRLEARLAARGFRVLRSRETPANDGGLALGQIAVARLHSGGDGNVSCNTR